MRRTMSCPHSDTLCDNCKSVLYNGQSFSDKLDEVLTGFAMECVETTYDKHGMDKHRNGSEPERISFSQAKEQIIKLVMDDVIGEDAKPMPPEVSISVHNADVLMNTLRAEQRKKLLDESKQGEL